TAIDKAGALAPAMGASRMGTRNPNRVQKASADFNVERVGSGMGLVGLAELADSFGLPPRTARAKHGESFDGDRLLEK
ncbi:MAG: hypothetical protein JO069_16960, partial [Verrucomicrobia bacterium]|nr:hypothetical protein [Verrucomicrobiota bacterium]